MSHTFKSGKVSIIHNGDWSGEAEVVDTRTGDRVTVPCETLLMFAADYVRQERQRSLDALDWPTLLGLDR